MVNQDRCVFTPEGKFLGVGSSNFTKTGGQLFLSKDLQAQIKVGDTLHVDDIADDEALVVTVSETRLRSSETLEVTCLIVAKRETRYPRQSWLMEQLAKFRI